MVREPEQMLNNNNNRKQTTSTILQSAFLEFRGFYNTLHLKMIIIETHIV